METLADIAISNGVTPEEWRQIQVALRPLAQAVGGCAAACAGCPFAQQCHGGEKTPVSLDFESLSSPNDSPKPVVSDQTMRYGLSFSPNSNYKDRAPKEAACSGCGKTFQGSGVRLCKSCQSSVKATNTSRLSHRIAGAILLNSKTAY